MPGINHEGRIRETLFRPLLLSAIAITVICQNLTTAAEPEQFNRAPLAAKPFAELPLGTITPEGWLLDELQRMADGMTGHLDEWYPDEGVDIVQIDDPHLCLFVDPDVRAKYSDAEAATDFAVDMINQVVEGVEGLKIAVHLCRLGGG